MTTHLGRVKTCDFAGREVQVILGSSACRVCGGRDCALKDRVIRATLRDEAGRLSTDLRPGDVVRIATDSCAMTRAALRLVVIPLGAGVMAAVVAPAVAVVAGLAGALVALGVSIALGSRRRDLPFVVEKI